jgi:hypothetical protein
MPHFQHTRTADLIADPRLLRFLIEHQAALWQQSEHPHP